MIKIDNKKIYFAYGGNINQKQMAHRCPSAKILGTGFIAGYELQFKGVATIAPNEKARVPVLAYTLGELDARNLDAYEGFPNTYIKENFDVKIGEETYSGMAYMLNKYRPLMKPSSKYFHTIAEGYQDAGFDMKYLRYAYRQAEQAEQSRSRIYIAYGSNINQQQMAMRCPRAEVICTGTLPEYQLQFRTHATVEPKEGYETPVLIWNISEKNEFALDQYESYPSYYRKEYFEFQYSGKSEVAMAYVMNGNQISPPANAYYNGILAGYKEAGLDVSKLEQALEESREFSQKEKQQFDMNQLWLE